MIDMQVTSPDKCRVGKLIINKLISINMEKTVDTLVPGECLLASVKAVKGNKYQLEFAEVISNPNAVSADPLTALFNASDPRFTSKARRAWKSGEKSDIESLLGITLGNMSEGDVKELNILNPTMGDKSLKIRILETVEPDDYQKDNIETTAKKAGADGDFIYSGGKHIFSNTRIVATDGEVDHIFLPADAPVTESAAPSSSSEELVA